MATHSQHLLLYHHKNPRPLNPNLPVDEFVASCEAKDARNAVERSIYYAASGLKKRFCVKRVWREGDALFFVVIFFRGFSI